MCMTIFLRFSPSSFDLSAQRTRARESSGVDMEYPLRNRIMVWEAMCKGP